MKSKSHVKVQILDLRGANPVFIAESIRDHARRDGLGDSNLLYSGLDGHRHSTLIKYGTLYPESNFIYASEHVDKNGEYGGASPLSCALGKERGMMAIYDKGKFKQGRDSQYHFNDPKKKLEALLAVYIMNM